MRNLQQAGENPNYEACGVFGIYASNAPVAELTYLGLLSLQHRGQDAAGIAVSIGNTITVVKNSGLLISALDNGQSLASLPNSEFATGHVLYSTSRATSHEEAFLSIQPLIGGKGERLFTVSHNGHIINVSELQEEYQIDGHMSDSELVTQVISHELESKPDLQGAVIEASKKFNGAYSLVIMGNQELIGIRDPKGFRPLMLGELPDGGSVLASELAALDIINAQIVREIEPGELVKITSDGIESVHPFDKEDVTERLCAFEYVYFSRPDNKLLGENVEQTRFRMGQELARIAPVEADIVIGVPNSGISAAYGYVDQSKIPIQQGITKNGYVHRSFIAPSQIERERIVQAKLNVNGDIVDGQKVILVDDSLIRSTTTATMIEELKNKGATEVHLRIASPPYKWPCFYGMNTGDINELVAASMTTDQIREAVGADSLAYLPARNFKMALRMAAKRVCMACMDGRYPTSVPAEDLVVTVPQP